MGYITLEELEALARDESAKLQHYYIGVEHLFMALTRLEGSITSDVLQVIGASPRYLRYAAREMTGSGDERRYWSGYPPTPRAVAVLGQARATIRQGVEPPERAVLLAILDEGESIPVRVLRDANIDLAKLQAEIRDWSGEARVILPPTAIEGGERLTTEQRDVLQHMFRNYAQVRIEQLFTDAFSGFSGSTVMLVRPLHADKRSDALVVVKLYDRQAILWEKKRYDSFVRDRLPPKTSRIEADPTLPDHSWLGGLKYTFIRRGDEALPINLAQLIADHKDNPEAIARFTREGLFEGFRETWWGQSQPYSFIGWHEYELMLPPAAIAEAVTSDSVSRTLRPLEEWSRDGSLRPDEVVALEDFTVIKVKNDSNVLQLASGAEPAAINYANRIDLRGLDLTGRSHYRGERIRKLYARIARTREDILQEQVQALEPDFNILSETLPPLTDAGKPQPDNSAGLPNPLRCYTRLLEQRIVGTLSTIHGDLHTGNVLVGPGGDAWLIDFEWARDGHTLFDWAVLEVSILIDHIVNFVDQDWHSIRRAATALAMLNPQGAVEEGHPLAVALYPVVEIRRIVSTLLANKDNWAEYYVPLALCALRVISWSNRPLVARRLAFLASALATDAADHAIYTFLQTSADRTDDDKTTDDMNVGHSIDGLSHHAMNQDDQRRRP